MIVNKSIKVRFPWEILLVIIVVFGAYLRLVGLDWDSSYHLHPDERFLNMVETAIRPVSSLKDYLNTSTSTLNPQNVGYSFFVYGTFPIFIVRFLAQTVNQAGYDQVQLVGRTCSAFADIGTIILVFFITQNLFRRKWGSLLASGFYAFAVLPIQLSHFFTVDTFSNFFGMLTLFLLTYIQKTVIKNPDPEKAGKNRWVLRLIIFYAAAGMALGMAAASKINTILLALIFPLASLLSNWFWNKEDRPSNSLQIMLAGWVTAALFFLITFRFLQPYAFSGPGLISGLNENWLANLKELSALSSSTSGYPPSVQWADRTIFFALGNLVKYGLGIPLGLTAMIAAAVGYFIIKKEDRASFLMILIWGGGYTLWQASQHTNSMRYLMITYPLFCILAAILLVAFWEKGQQFKPKNLRLGRIVQTTSIILAITVSTVTALWAFAFSTIYTREITRIEASEWIYQNIPGPVNLHLKTAEVEKNQPLSYPLTLSFSSGLPVSFSFVPEYSGSLVSLNFDFIKDPFLLEDQKTLLVEIIDPISDIVYPSQISNNFTSTTDQRGSPYAVPFDGSLELEAGRSYQCNISIVEPQKNLSFMGEITLTIAMGDSMQEVFLQEAVHLLSPGDSWQTSFTTSVDAILNTISLNRVVDWRTSANGYTLMAAIYANTEQGLTPLGDARVSISTESGNHQVNELTFLFLDPVELLANVPYILEIKNVQGESILGIYGSKQALESPWDDPLPYAVYGSNAFDYYNGVYRTDLNFEIYWDDTIEKYDRMISILNKADTLFISSSRQWGSLSRLPDYYPLTTEYYRALIGCPANREVTWCYSVANPGMFEGELGFELIKTFTSEPQIGLFNVNTQFAEEAFTVYDHPKVFIFKKSADFNINAVKSILGSVSLDNVPSINNYDGSDHGNLMLAEDDKTQQEAAGTWNELFPQDSVINRYPFLALITWYFFLALLGICSYPLTRLVFRGLKDKGYGFSRLLSLIILAWLVWIGGSNGILVTRNFVLGMAGVYLVMNVILAILFWHDLQEELKLLWRTFLTTELVLLGFFIFFLFIRIGNPDLWHPYKGGEKPMDISYFTAILKSDSFPPYDPWYAGGYINYYYYGYVIVGMPVKVLGIMPSIAYNLILPTLFSFVGAGAFSIGSTIANQINILPRKQNKDDPKPCFPDWIGGLIAAVLILVLGNLGTVSVIINGFQKIASEGLSLNDASFGQRFIWTFKGIAEFFKGKTFTYAPGEWYWLPSRAIPGEAITEFPYFTFLYADLHAHMLALPVTIMAIGWSMAMVLRKWTWRNSVRRFGWFAFGVTFFCGGAILGALKPTNTWDTYTYLPFALIAVVYSAIRYSALEQKHIRFHKKYFAKIILAIVCALILFSLSTFMYQDFSQWYRQGYNEIDLWQGAKTPFGSFIMHWGLFLFVIASWLFYEIWTWMAQTPASALKGIKPFREVIWIGLALIPVLIFILIILNIEISIVVIPLIAMGIVLIFRRNYPDVKRFLLFLMLTGLVLTLVVEIIVLKGDIGRMNTVFKIYMQAWTLISVSSAGMLYSLFLHISGKRTMVQKTWLGILIVLISCAFLFTTSATLDKVTDRMSADAPHSLDGSLYMMTSTYFENGETMDLEQDYQAIRWMQQNIAGTPTIVEGNVSEYRWGTRYTINTGLPGVVGWNWHQRQQRGVYSAELVQKRVDEVGNFYNTVNLDDAVYFLEKYDVRYIIVGQMEKAVYSQEGIVKFVQNNGILWEEVYQYKDTAIYKVLD